MIAADDEFENLEFGRIDLRQSAPTFEPVATVPFDGRALTFDGTMWWTSDRDKGEIVAFTPQ
jgi:hypothetical protein